MGKYSSEQKLWAINQRLEKHRSYVWIANKLGANSDTVIAWLRLYQSFGSDVFLSNRHSHYSKEFKFEAVEYYLKGHSLRDTCLEYKIKSTGQLREWLSVYNSHEELRATPRRGRIMTKGRRTTLEERVSIVADCIANGCNYRAIAEKYSVSYQQVTQWVKKFNANGVKGLEDHRGKRKTEAEMTELEKLQAENRILKAKLERKELENLYLKKVNEIEGGWS